MVNCKSPAIAFDEATGLQRYGFVETRFLVFLCNHLHELQAAMLAVEFDEYVANSFKLDVRDLSKKLDILGKDARRIFSHVDEKFNRGIEGGEDGLWVIHSHYESGEIELKLSPQFIQLLKEKNPYLFKFSIRHIRNINSVSAIRFLNFLYAQRPKHREQVEITLSLEEIRSIFGVERSYTCLSNIRSKVIGKSVALINEHTRFIVKVQRKASIIEDLNYTFNVVLNEKLAA